MIHREETTPGQVWHSNDFLVRIARRHEVGGLSEWSPTSDSDEVTSAADITYGKVTLALVASDLKRHERLSLLRSTAFFDQDLLAFGARVGSTWALDVLAGRLTRQTHDWASFRAVLLDVDTGDHDAEHMLDGISLDRLLDLGDMLHARRLDPHAERAVLRFVADRALAGGAVSKRARERLIERLIQVGLAKPARALLQQLTDRSWLRHVYAVELAHPRFGGDFDSMLRLLNEPYRRIGIEPISLASAGRTPFRRLHSSAEVAVDTGPLVTVVMTCRRPGEEVIAAARSIVEQSYQNWEMIVVDDASPAGFEPVFERIRALDVRIRIIHRQANLGTFVCRNEAIAVADGELVAIQDVNSWSHPRRLEIQVGELLAHPAQQANVVHAAQVTEQFSFVSGRGVNLKIADASLMFRRESVASEIGYYDAVREGADIEFVKRLEAVTERPVPGLVAGAPLQFALRDALGRPGGRTATWGLDHADQLTYWSAADRHIQRIVAGESSGFTPHPLPAREFHAPDSWRADERPPRPSFDLLVVLDGRESPQRTEFHASVAEELSAAAADGMRVGLLQSDSLTGPRGRALYSAVLQDLVDEGTVDRVGPSEFVSASTVVVRHAGAAQGHPDRRMSVTASRVIVVDDPAAGDVRGATFAKPDVDSTVAAWFGIEPVWTRALPRLPQAAITTAVVDEGELRLSIATAAAASVKTVRMTDGEQTLEIVPTVSMDGVTCAVAVDALVPGVWSVVVEHDGGGGAMVTLECPMADDALVWNQGSLLAVRAEDGGIRLVASESADGLPGADELIAQYLSASVSVARVVGERFEVILESKGASYVVGLYAQREVDGVVVRRRDFSSVTTAGVRVWKRRLSKFAESRWRLFGAFRTPLGTVEYPVAFDDDVSLSGTANWVPQVLSGNRILVAPPRPTRLVRATRQVSGAISARVPERPGRLRVSRARLEFDSRHSASRLPHAPTVSVVMPVYNVEPYLEAAIKSVLDQDFRDIELILVDDASKDNGRRIIHKYWRRDPRVRVFALDHNTLGGAGIPSNIGVRAARGRYVAFADSDDHVSTGGLAKLVEAAESHEAELVIGDFCTFTDKLTEGAESYDSAVWSEVPLGTPIDAMTYPALFRLSAVPWRKLYRRSFLHEHAILYPEGDYFYEDNPLHWFVLARAHRVVACKEIISFHRMEREGQTMSAQKYKLGAFVNHANTILNFLAASTDERRDSLFESFFNFLDRTLWVATSQSQPTAAAMIRRGFGEIYERAVAMAPAAVVPARTHKKLTEFRSAYPDLDLTVVIPVYNSSELLKSTLDSVLAMHGLRFDVLLVDDGSTDNSLAIMEDYERKHSNVHVFAQGNRGAGRARNSVIPLCAGRYTYFLDADDVVRPDALVAAVKHADEESADLLFVQYGVEYTDEGRSRGMFNADAAIWKQIPRMTRNEEMQRLAAKLINYPWNRIIRTSLLHDANIFFGPTIVHNDVLFHWHTIASARRISYLGVEACVHRKFTSREQVTNISDARRMAVLEALRGTSERISGLPSYPVIRSEWEDFVEHLLGWAKSRIPDELQERYSAQSEALTQTFE